MYDSLGSKDLVHLIATMVYSKLPEMKIVMMDVEQQTNGSDCGVLSIAYAFDICSGLNPCVVRFDHSRIRQHLANCLENCQVTRFPIHCTYSVWYTSHCTKILVVHDFCCTRYIHS